MKALKVQDPSVATRTLEAQAASEERYIVPALLRGLQLLKQFNALNKVLTGAELSRRLQLPRASVFRMLQTLEHEGFVERVGDSVGYKLSLGVLRLGFEYLASLELTEHGKSVVQRLRDESGFAAHLAVRDAREVVFVHKAPGLNASFHSIQVGARLPAHATVLGRMLLSDLSLEALKILYPEAELERFTHQTPKNTQELKRMMDQERSQGYSLSQGGFEDAISTLAAPVLDDDRHVIAALSITIPSAKLPDLELESLISMVQSCAQELSARMSRTP
jgi:DNA-binding IclR family transcriptional regulator